MGLGTLNLPGLMTIIFCEGCKGEVGAMHVPVVGGYVLFFCQKCGVVTGCKNQMYGIKKEKVTRLTPSCG